MHKKRTNGSTRDSTLVPWLLIPPREGWFFADWHCPRAFAFQGRLRLIVGVPSSNCHFVEYDCEPRSIWIEREFNRLRQRCDAPLWLMTDSVRLYPELEHVTSKSGGLTQPYLARDFEELGGAVACICSALEAARERDEGVDGVRALNAKFEQWRSRHNEALSKVSFGGGSPRGFD